MSILVSIPILFGILMDVLGIDILMAARFMQTFFECGAIYCVFSKEGKAWFRKEPLVEEATS